MKSQTQDQINLSFLKLLSLTVIFLMLCLVGLLIDQALPAIQESGSHFLSSDWWNPVAQHYGALSFIFGTLVTSLLALVMATPISLCLALFIDEHLPPSIGRMLAFAIELIASIPSIILGLWGLFYLVPFIKKVLAPALQQYSGDFFLFDGPTFGVSLLCASLVLTIMIFPTMTSVAREVFKSVPRLHKEAALSLGATRWEMTKLAILRPSRTGIIGAIILGFGRALGETMAVTMVIGNEPVISTSLLAPGATMASVIANEYAEAVSDQHVSALCLIGLMLFIITLVTNLMARMIIKYVNKQRGQL